MKRYTNSEIKARLVLVVAVALAITFVAAVLGLLYGLLFVTQPLEVSPNDESAWKVISPMLMTLSGGLIGVLAANGLKDKEPKDDPNA